MASLFASCARPVLRACALLSFAVLGACGGSIEQGGAGPAASAARLRCVPAGIAPTVLVKEDAHLASSLVPHGEDVWFLWVDMRVSRASAAIRKVAVRASGSPVEVVEDGAFAIGARTGGTQSFGLLGQQLVHHGIESDGTKGGDFRTGIVLLDAAGRSRVLASPRPLSVISSLVVGDTGIAWATTQQSSAMGRSSIAVWHEGAEPEEIAVVVDDPALVTDGTSVYFKGTPRGTPGKPGAEVSFESAPLAGGPPRIVRSFPLDGSSYFTLRAADASGIVYVRRGAHGLSELFASDAGGQDRLLTSSPRLAGPLVADAGGVFAVDALNPRSIVRIDRRGGPVRAEGADIEEIVTRPSRISSLAVDACNVYWVEDGAVMAMQKTN
jgi:hypothetical protein